MLQELESYWIDNEKKI